MPNHVLISECRAFLAGICYTLKLISLFHIRYSDSEFDIKNSFSAGLFTGAPVPLLNQG